ncbi:MAG TPA: hypothetical protein VHE09_16410, partial [Rhizomicrobium sp.]|nr:hypothetical protein [Rhizomicrobium sp.]
MTEVFAESPPALKSLDLQTHSGLIPIRWPPLDEAHAMQLLGLLAGCFGFAVIVFFVLLFARNRAERLFPQREESSSAPHTFALIIKRTPALSLAAAALAIAARVFGIWAPWIRAVFVAALIVQAGLWGVTFIDAMSRRFLERQGDPRSMASAISLVRVLSR